METKTILGIDPGSNVMGYGVIRIENKHSKLVAFDVISVSPKMTHYEKLKYIFDHILNVIDQYNPDEVALEAPFFGKNVQSMLKLGRSQGVAMAAALLRNKPIFEYAPLKVKQAITGMGQAAKEQVAYFLQKIYGFDEIPKALDATDAVAVALCHWLESSKPMGTKPYKGWDDFVRKNPDRIK